MSDDDEVELTAAEKAAVQKHWCFTLNNYTPADEAYLATVDVQYIYYGHEIGKKRGTPHLQGFVCFKTNHRLKAASKVMRRCSLRPMRGSVEQNHTYCSKEGKDIVTRGTPPKTKKENGADERARHDAAYIAAKEGRLDDIPGDIMLRSYGNIKRIAFDHQRPPPGLEGELINEWIYGPAGTGKSTRAFAENPGAYLKAVNKWWDGYTDHATVIVEDMDPFHKSLALEFKLWGQHQPFPAESKGSTTAIRPKKIVVTSNYSIDEVWDDPTTREAMHRRYREIYVGHPGVTSPPSPHPYCEMQCNPKKRKSP